MVRCRLYIRKSIMVHNNTKNREKKTNFVTALFLHFPSRFLMDLIYLLVSSLLESELAEPSALTILTVAKMIE